ncbi:transketolase [Candidatus Kaiserbacteria bacterium RIFCSPLOWO2_02_FULL_56_11]|uniref:Transketolase n=2 Tax=Candidatus Kaiseribacteriota TaxID=1752734 RepID=A0A1F6E2C8_9BACT|nr:MAG: transketolase [Candidatus Kaiserbacteria bacterium RIFCSPHIGHO2_02_FULL_56_30]OGG71960.1 MAG: transketolase [Candidatus Kaiserbacteria bacterium RIFCSPHIGHO2_12_FULL_56_13]OGG82395.1 MAG: transketolase [Candidatus Kaiserbacteria bacterium RIFCSPLOWO2_02_FULL_56_11]
MLNVAAKLVAEPFSDKVTKAPTRDGFGKGVVEAGKANKNVVVLCADLKESTRAEWFEKEFPERFIEVGVAEQAMATIASGMALAGKIPFIASYACFSPGRNYEQIRTTIALNKVSVKVCGMHAGVSVGADGATHQMLEDIGMMRMLPGMTVINPCDALEARKATVAAAKVPGPMYLRFGRAGVPIFTTPDTPFSIGKALILWQGENPKVALLATGSLSYNALAAARALDADGIASLVLHVPTIKPLDEAAIIEAAKRTRRIVTIEEHQVAGGFGSAVAELLSEKYPAKIKRLGIEDEFGQSGDPDELIEHYGLGASSIRHAAETFIKE